MRRASRILATATLVVGAIAVSAAPAIAGEDGNGRDRMTVEVAEDGTRFVFDEAPVLGNGFPAYGNGFVTQGYIYPAGTLDGTNGVNPDGSPEFPDRVIGEWTCWGYFVGDGADTTEGAWVVTTQVFDFHSSVVGGDTIVTTGFETPAGAGPALRAVVGGTGRYRQVQGQVTQITLGHNGTDGVDATFELDLRGVRHQPASSASHQRSFQIR